MKTQKRSIKTKFWKIIIVLAIIGIGTFSFYTIKFRNDWGFGIKDLLFGQREGLELDIIDYEEDSLDEIPLRELLSNKSDVKHTNSLCLVNKKHKIDDEADFDLTNFRDTSLLLDRQVIDDFENLLTNVKKDTEQKVLIMSTYRSKDDQERIYEENPKIAAPANASEHQTGLALDLYVHKKAQREFIDTEAGKWIHHNGWKHGFIIRYPFLKKHRTGIGYEPWHIRYVGKPHAEIIYKKDLTFEQYITSLEKGVFYGIDGYVLSRQSPKDDKLKVPSNIVNMVLSPDNTGSYIITGKITMNQNSAD